jgi:site-specific recombinase XerD
MMDQHLTLEQTLDAFIVALADKNRSRATRKAYRLDLQHFITFLHATNLTISHPAQVQCADITAYLAFLAHQQLSGATRARKVAALREYFRYLGERGILAQSPMMDVETPPTHLLR